jgi:hypothetical protein
MAPNATNATNATTAAPNATTIAPTPVPTTALPFVQLTLNTTLAQFNETVFKERAAAVVGLNASQVDIISVRAGSVIVDFRFRDLANAAAIATAVSQFTANVRNNAAFTSAFPVLAVTTVTPTPAPRISASSSVVVSAAVMVALLFVTFF